jgi:hypothetical protein
MNAILINLGIPLFLITVFWAVCAYYTWKENREVVRRFKKYNTSDSNSGHRRLRRNPFIVR